MNITFNTAPIVLKKAGWVKPYTQFFPINCYLCGLEWI